MPKKKLKKYVVGGNINGPSHDNGGVIIEAEGGDYIINKDQFLFPETKGDDLPEGLLPASNTPPLQPTPQPVVNNVQMASAKDPQTNLTGTEEALLSPSEKIIAART